MIIMEQSGQTWSGQPKEEHGTQVQEPETVILYQEPLEVYCEVLGHEM